MRLSLAILSILLLADSTRCAYADRKPLDEESLRSYVAESMTSSSARLIRMRLTSDKSLFETTMEFYRSYEPSKGRLANALLDSIQSQATIAFRC
jgi:hypothetical protein